MSRFLAVLLFLACALSACTPMVQEEEKNAYILYYPVANLETVAGKDAVASRKIVVDGAEGMDTEELTEILLQKLLASAPDAEVMAPIRNGTVLNGVSVTGQWAQVDFSGAYASLTGVDLTLADYCVALTLTQLEGVNAVTITAEGKAHPQRGDRPLLAADALLSTTEPMRRTFTALLYFYDEAQGTLQAERRALALYEGQSRSEVLLEALMAGPEDENLRPILPEGFVVLSSRMEENTCYLNLPHDTPLGETDPHALRALVNSLCSLNNVEQVQIVLEGEFGGELGGISLAEPLVPGAF